MEMVFYKSKEYPGYYLIYKGLNGVNAERMLRVMTNAGEFENSGYPKVDIELGFIFKTDAPDSFLDYLTEKVATNHIAHSKYNDVVFRAWYEFKDVENADKWLADYYSYQNENKASSQVIQAVLF
jgi:hypothetical protein